MDDLISSHGNISLYSFPKMCVLLLLNHVFKRAVFVSFFKTIGIFSTFMLVKLFAFCATKYLHFVQQIVCILCNKS